MKQATLEHDRGEFCRGSSIAPPCREIERADLLVRDVVEKHGFVKPVFASEGLSRGGPFSLFEMGKKPSRLIPDMSSPTDSGWSA